MGFLRMPHQYFHPSEVKRMMTANPRKRPSVLHLVSGLLCILLAGLTTSCKDNDEKPVTTIPKNVAEKRDSVIVSMYSAYINRNYEKYISYIESNDNKPASYRKHMVDLLKERYQQQVELHKGPKSCRVIRVEDKGKEYRDVVLEVTFNDKEKENIILPMVKVNGQWRIR